MQTASQSEWILLYFFHPLPHHFRSPTKLFDVLKRNKVWAKTKVLNGVWIVRARGTQLDQFIFDKSIRKEIVDLFAYEPRFQEFVAYSFETLVTFIKFARSSGYFFLFLFCPFHFWTGGGGGGRTRGRTVL